jgi:hypothetical protein
LVSDSSQSTVTPPCLGDPPQRLGPRQPVDTGVEELAQRRAVDPGVAQERRDPLMLPRDQPLKPLAEGRRQRPLVHRRSPHEFATFSRFRNFLR